MERDAYIALDSILTGRRIKSLIMEKGYSVRKLQLLLNLSCPQPVYRWIKGQTLPSVDHLYMMHRIFGVHMEEMLVAKDEADMGEVGWKGKTE